MDRCKDNYYYLIGDYHPDFYDDVYEVYGQFCKRSGDRDNHILKQAHHDGEDVTILLPVDPGSAGKSCYESMACKFMAEGFIVKPDPLPTNKSKLTKFQPFATACENGLVFIVEDSFDKKTLEYIMKQLEAFDGTRSTRKRHDEFADVCSCNFNNLSKAKVYQPFTLPTINAPTKLSKFSTR